MYDFNDNIKRQIKYCTGLINLYSTRNKDKYWYYIGMQHGFIEISDKRIKLRFEDKYKSGFNYLKGYLEAYRISLSYALSIKQDTGHIRDNY